MTLTTAQLDAIATKLLGWTKFMDGVFKRDQDDTEYCGRLSPADAMLVLEAMTRQGFIFTLKGWPDGHRCSAGRSADSQIEGKDAVSAWANAHTIAEAVFICAAQLVERMSP